jgi:hypothetical protein
MRSCSSPHRLPSSMRLHIPNCCYQAITLIDPKCPAQSAHRNLFCQRKHHLRGNHGNVLQPSAGRWPQLSYLTASGLVLLGGIFLAGPAYAEDALAVFRGGRLGALFMRGGTTSLIFANQSAAIISA